MAALVIYCDFRSWTIFRSVHAESIGVGGKNIEYRPIWKSMDQQPVFRAARTFFKSRADLGYATGPCLPSSLGINDLGDEEVCSMNSGTLGA
jgi:hypothetical protein